MILHGPERYDLRFNAKKFNVTPTSGESTLSDRVRARRPKLYVVAKRGHLIYVGITNQPICSRLRLGWKADGSTGYYGYAFRRHLTSASLFVWFHQRTRGRAALRELETIEAEVAYAVRRQGQWPKFQTEIHFYPSSVAHRREASKVVSMVRRSR